MFTLFSALSALLAASAAINAMDGKKSAFHRIHEPDSAQKSAPALPTGHAHKTPDSLCAACIEQDARERRVVPAPTLSHLEAARLGDFSGIPLTAKKFKRKNIDPNKTDFLGKTLLHYATSFNNLPVAQRLLQMGADPNCATPDGLTPLSYAAWYGYPSLVQVLLAYGANPHTANANGLTPLHLATRTATHQVITMLLTAGADPNTSNNKGLITPLHCAVIAGQLKAVQLLLADGAIPSANANGSSLLMHACTTTTDMDLVNFLLTVPAVQKTINFPNNLGNTPLHHAACIGSITLAQRLVAAGAGSCPNKNGMTPLDCAREREHQDAALYLQSVTSDM